ncbi:hypothetical protein AAES_108032 [Amazona aestiva]|uniref:Cadherin domain-containing protein n=1 Tax=Amazona aestiva TaxID=12930 RepID=A0A0Q3PT39_AMAAE|nr:hypothetical protein AAES_108032 [Amazona aestiva]
MGGVCRGPLLLVLQLAWGLVGGQVRYSVPEEAKAGTVVGRLAQDLGLEAGEPEARRLRLVSQGRRASVEGPFRVGLYSGEVVTARSLEEADGPRQRLVIVVRDHGEPARSATATLSVSLPLMKLQMILRYNVPQNQFSCSSFSEDDTSDSVCKLLIHEENAFWKNRFLFGCGVFMLDRVNVTSLKCL